MGGDRQSVKTYVPTEQKDVWRDHADELDMSLSEFVRTMVQAGRRGFAPTGSEGREESPSQPADPGGSDLEKRVHAALESGPRSWDELVQAVVGDVEDELEETLDELQERNRIRYSGREGGYVLTDE
ncbi:DUF5805 domain-containing protein [Halorubrum ezzemoulense]|uniref:Uncharacterized protein n=1 Tax=Halorubrum ezzemoulense TaxID=337243 RepID=A0A256JTP2_HALEZ|nr:DUF5805 domain-containing protein [Halorubrum ezzemoulense]MDB9232697.1 DUF5805 domain-containing protein [Halorubrum ezzemoulense]OYR71012.1 hypothetical protein DJ76_15755 [Halorubrum ezzemoulense]OYR71587.1 hypothetical protein DJ78_05070 [Halorubrum ezzemoulense]